MKGIIFPLLVAVGLALAAEGSGSVLGSTEAYSGQDSEGQPAVYAVSVLLDGALLASLAAVPGYAECATACRLSRECKAFMYCGAQVRDTRGGSSRRTAPAPPQGKLACDATSARPSHLCRLPACCRATAPWTHRSASC